MGIFRNVWIIRQQPRKHPVTSLSYILFVSVSDLRSVPASHASSRYSQVGIQQVMESRVSRKLLYSRISTNKSYIVAN